MKRIRFRDAEMKRSQKDPDPNTDLYDPNFVAKSLREKSTNFVNRQYISRNNYHENFIAT